MKPLLSIQDAEKAILENLTIADAEYVPLEQASFRVLRENLVADRDAPPFDRVMMDGIAIHSSEFTGIGSHFTLAGTQAAGSKALVKTEPQTCFEVMTGAPLPEGCDCVIPVEEISITETSVILSPDADVEAGKFIHPTGSDSQQGSMVLAKNSLLSSAELAIAASMGYANLSVSRIPRITILTSGDEVVSPEKTPEPFQIRSSHPSAILSMIHRQHLGICRHIHLPDAVSVSRAAMETAMETSDFIILTGGVSKGKFDFIAPTLSELVGPPIFHGVKQRPGKPLGYWKTPTSPHIFALPGNPVSVMATATRYVLPALKSYLGIPQAGLTRPLAEPFHWTAPLPGFVPVKITSNGAALPSPVRNSGDFLSLAGCTGFIECKPNSPHLALGAPQPYFPFL